MLGIRNALVKSAGNRESTILRFISSAIFVGQHELRIFLYVLHHTFSGVLHSDRAIIAE